MRDFLITPNESGQRLDKYLKKILPNAGAGFLYRMLRKKNITWNGRRAAGSELLQDGDHVKLFLSEDTFLKFAADRGEQQREYEMLGRLSMRGLNVIYEDADILAADKPYNMLSQKAEASDVSANEILLGYLIRTNALGPEDFCTFRPSVCNRLDRNTTGLILMGKTLKGAQWLSKGLRVRSIQKYYRAVVSGELKETEHLKGYLLKDEVQNRVQIVQQDCEGAVPIETEYRVISHSGAFTLLEIHLITGKTHQIRAHLASIGHPVAGDPKYGDGRVNRSIREALHVKHQLLHAYRVELPDSRVICADTPEVFARVMEIGEKIGCQPGIPAGSEAQP